MSIAEHSALEETVGALRRWLASGAIQSPGGAFCAWKDAATGQLAFEYPEITGYALTYLAASDPPSEPELVAGDHAARWLADRLEEGRLGARAEWDGQAVYNFDLAMIASGMATFGRATGDERAVAAAAEVVDDLVAQHRKAGALPSIRESSHRPSMRSSWSTEGFAHLVKAVQCLLVDGREDARAVADEIIAHSERFQRDDGRFETHPSDAETMLHPHLYAMEGLWMYAEATGDRNARERAERGTRWAWEHQLPTGGLPRFVATAGAAEPAVEQWDLTGQGIRMAVVLGQHPSGLSRAVERLAGGAIGDGDAGAALPYQPEADAGHLNAWVSMFGHQALRLAHRPERVLPWQHLV